MLTQAHVYVKGDVTRVGFRAWMNIRAKECHVHGWVRNVFNNPAVFGPYGGVEMLLQGDDQDVLRMITHAKEGSTTARVDDVDFRLEDAKDLYDDFLVLKDEAFSHHE